MEKFFIKNRFSQNISVILEDNNNPQGLVFIMHGLGASKDECYMERFAKAFREKNFIVVRFDNRHSIGESEGNYYDVNFSNTYEDLEDVIAWAKKEKWYKEPFVLVGHSLGAGCILWYSANHPNEVAGLVPLSTAISGQQALMRFRKSDLSLPAKMRQASLSFKVIKTLKWRQFRDDILKYNIIPEAPKFVMPFLMMVGDEDINTPLEDQRQLYDLVPEPKEIHIIKGAGHTFRSASHLDQAEEILKKWIDNTILSTKGGVNK
ncbi:MAG: alpha/beta fold hydrolase [Patescibacteria group bacterium]|jgi:hypothetical protein